VDLLDAVGLYEKSETRHSIGEDGDTPSSTLDEKKSMSWSANSGLLTNVGEQVALEGEDKFPERY
jgi:hypothetical protein